MTMTYFPSTIAKPGYAISEAECPRLADLRHGAFPCSICGVGL